MRKEKVGWGFKLNPDLEEAYNYAKREFQIENLPGALLWYTDANGNTHLFKDSLKLPYEFRYNLNEEVDSAVVELYSKCSSDIVLNHKLPNLAKIRIVHDVPADLASQDDLLQYDNYGRPTNFDDYYIAAGTCQFKGSGDGERYEHHYELAEPIYVTRYVMCENRTFTNMTSITVTDAATGQAQTYTQEPTNLLNMLESILRTTGVKTSKEDTTWYSKIKIMDKDLLRNSGVGRSINFNTASLYDNLFKIGKYIKRYPVLYFNKYYDPSLGENLWNDTYENRREFLLFFEKYDGSDKPEITMTEFKENSTGFMESQGAFKDAGTIVNDAQNVASDNAVWYPGYGSWITFTGDEDKLDFDYKTGVLRLPDNIDEVLDLRCFAQIKSSQGQADNTSGICKQYVKSIPCVEHKDWLLMDDNTRRQYMWYEKGKNIINGFDFERLTQSGSKECAFCVKYKPLYPLRIIKKVNNKLQGNITQLDSLVNSDLWGSYMENYAEENSAIDITNGKIFYKYSDIWIPGTIVYAEETNSTFIIANAVVRRNNGYYIVSYTANENVIKRSEVVTTDDISDNKIIESDKSQLRLSNISENLIKLSLSYSDNSSINSKYVTNLPAMIIAGMSDNECIADSTYIDFILYASENQHKYIDMPTRKSVFGSSIAFTFLAQSSMLLTTVSSMVGANDRINVKSDGINRFIKYTDSFGKLLCLSLVIPLCNYSEDNALTTRDYYTDGYEYGFDGSTGNITECNQRYSLILNNTQTYPNVEFSLIEQIKNTETKIFVRDYLYYKETNEAMNISLQFDFAPYDKNTFFNPLLMQCLMCVNEDDQRQLYALSIDSNYKVGKGDTISPSKCYHPMCYVTVPSTNATPLITIDNSGSEKFKTKNGWQIALGVLRDDGDFDILIASKVEGLSDELVELNQFFLNINMEE